MLNRNQKSMRDIAYDLLSKKKNPVVFDKLWKEVSEILGLSEEEAKDKIGRFYTHITLDGRFVLLENNTWDLRSRHKFEEITIDMNDLYDEDESEEDIIDEDDDNGYLNSAEEDEDSKKTSKNIYEDDDINDI